MTATNQTRTESQKTPNERAAPGAMRVADELPEGWVETALGEGLALNVQPGFACGSHNRDAQGIPHLRPMNVSQEGRIDLGNLKFVLKEEVHREERLLRSGDVLFNNTNSPELVGKTACYDLPEPRAFSNHMTRVHCHAEVLDARYCALNLHSKWMGGYFESICNNHVSQASISRTVLLQTPIPLPPLAEQKRIVAKVEGLVSHFRKMKTEQAELLATAFAAWNDMLIDGKQPTDNDVIREIREHWHEKKVKFEPDRINRCLDWMRKQNVRPNGLAPKTKQLRSC